MIEGFSFTERLLLRLDAIPHPMLDAVSSVVAARALHLSIKLGIVDAMEAGPQPISAIAKKTRLSERGVAVTVGCLDALGYAQKRDGYCELTSRGRRFLSRESGAGFRNMILFADYLYRTFEDLETTVANGGPDCPNYVNFDDDTWETFTEAMLELARTNVAEVTRQIPLPPGAKRVLDIGGSHGLYSVHLCLRAPALRAEVLDLAPVEPFTHRTFAEYGLQDRVRFRAGDFVQDDLGNDYDVALGFNIIHALSVDENAALAAKVYKALNSHGVYAVLDQIQEMRGRSQLARYVTATLGLNLFQQAGGCCYSYQEVSKWIKTAGFQRCRLIRLRATGAGLVIAWK